MADKILVYGQRPTPQGGQQALVAFFFEATSASGVAAQTPYDDMAPPIKAALDAASLEYRDLLNAGKWVADFTTNIELLESTTPESLEAYLLPIYQWKLALFQASYKERGKFAGLSFQPK